MKVRAILFLLLIGNLLVAQNLVRNPSFENTGPCPVVDSVFENFAEPWTTYFGTPDYFLQECGAPTDPFVTVNQQAFDQKAYTGITVYGDSGTAYIREYIHGALTEPLEAGKHYRVTFYVKPVNDDSRGVSYGINNLGLALTDEPMDSVPAENLYPVEPQVISKDVIINESYWTAICGVIVAKGGEEYLTIGNFSPDFQTQIVPLSGATNPFLAYYLVDYVQVVPNDLPQLPPDTIICEDQRIDLRIDAPDVNVVWEADGSTSKNFLITKPGIYMARISSPGCSYTDTIIVEAANCDECKVYVPNAFTPNGDGRNDLFKAVAEEGCEGFLSYHINIFNRWGEKVFEADSPEVAWDGSGPDGDYSQGVYTYTIEYEYPLQRETQTLTKRGFVLLLE